MRWIRIALMGMVVWGCSDGGDGSDAGGQDGREDAADGSLDAGDPGADSGGDPDGDAGEDGGVDAGGDPGIDGGGDPGADAGGDPGGDPGPLEGFRLVFEAGAQACGLFKDNRSWREELALLGRITFRPGVVGLPDDQDAFTRDFIHKVEFGPERLEAVQLGPAQVTREYRAYSDDQACHHYEFLQPFQLDGQDYAVRGEVPFCLQNGVPEHQEIVIDDDFTGQFYFLHGVLGDGSDYHSQLQEFGPCLYRELPLYLITAEVQGGDRLVLHRRYQPPFAGSGPANIVWADLVIDGVSREVADYFQLVYAAEHHNWNEQRLVLLDPPIGSVHGLLLLNTDYWQEPSELTYLDADLQVLTTRPLDSFQEVQQ